MDEKNPQTEEQAFDYRAEIGEIRAELEKVKASYNQAMEQVAQANAARDKAIKERNEANELYINSQITKKEENNIFKDLK